MKCPFKLPIKYEMKITTTEYVVIDAERKVIAKCNYEDDALFLQNAVNCHEKLVDALRVSPNNFPAKIGMCECKSCKNWRKVKSEALAEAEEKENG